ncbi:hypothetical protein P4639_27815 [Priestia megaterium]|uniref:hypothetical protein n=1 Tax=Priestia megaterium TaxID=1404 RepID=UPI002E21F326|nr:hypothetical protein [Priestia megaterium]
MPGFENKIWGFKYDEPYSKTCYKRVCTMFGCTNIPYPCFGMARKNFEILAGFNYPSVRPDQQTIIYGCADIAFKAAAAIVSAAVASCATLNPACVGIVAASVPAANAAGREAFYKCLNNSTLPKEIISQCKIGIYHRKT